MEVKITKNGIEHRESVSIQLSELLPSIEDNIRRELKLSKSSKIEYASNTTFLLFKIERKPDAKPIKKNK